jgi:glyoxylase-like metal-dependent hydrolase (beta-lactamase superfamily II)
MKKLLKVLGLLIVFLFLSLAGSLYAIFGHQQKPHTGPELGRGIEQVPDAIATTFILDPGNGKLMLVDAGNDPSGKPIMEALKHRNKGPADVEAIFITHAHPDHVGAIGQFPGAEIFAMQDEVEIAAGKEAYGSLFSKLFGEFNSHPFKVTHPLRDGESVQVGNLNITALEVSGHTSGSAVFLAQGVLYTGDALNITNDQKIEGPVRPFTKNYIQALNSLKIFLQKIAPRTAEIAFIATSHTGTIPGPQGLLGLSEFIKASNL